MTITNLERLQRIKEKLKQLANADPELKIFGAKAYGKIDNGHHYKLAPALTHEELAAFEAKHQTTLPEEYRLFLTEVGNGGAGPYYGIMPLNVGLDEAKVYSTGENELLNNPWSSDFPYSNSHVEKFIKYYDACIEEGEDDQIIYPEIPDELTGVIFLAEYGCGWSYFLVVKGEQAGTIWFHGEYICPSFVGNKQWSFFDWYEDWLDSSLKSFNPLVEKPVFDSKRTIVNYDGHQLAEIPQEVYICKNLKKLVFSGNKLTEFPIRVTEFNELRTLDLSMTPIIDIPRKLDD